MIGTGPLKSVRVKSYCSRESWLKKGEKDVSLQDVSFKDVSFGLFTECKERLIWYRWRKKLDGNFERKTFFCSSFLMRRTNLRGGASPLPRQSYKRWVSLSVCPLFRSHLPRQSCNRWVSVLVCSLITNCLLTFSILCQSTQFHSSIWYGDN